MSETLLQKKVGKAIVIHPPTMRALLLRLNAEERAKRSTADNEFDEWHVPGGSIEPEDEESTEAAAVRETQEETGLRVKTIRSLGTASWKAFYEGEPADFTAEFWLCTVGEDSTLPPEPVIDKESSAAAWVDKRELDSYIPHGLTEEALEYISKGVGYLEKHGRQTS